MTTGESDAGASRLVRVRLGLKIGHTEMLFLEEHLEPMQGLEQDKL